MNHRYGHIQSASWDYSLYDYSLFVLKKRLARLDFSSFFWEIGQPRNFLARGLSNHGFLQMQSAPCNTGLMNLGILELNNQLVKLDSDRYERSIWQSHSIVRGAQHCSRQVESAECESLVLIFNETFLIFKF